MKTIEFVSVTTRNSEQFKASPLARSLYRMGSKKVAVAVRLENFRPIPEWYNERIRVSNADVLAFVPDDVWLEDYHTPRRIIEALGHYDVVGISGNRRRLPQQPSWLISEWQASGDEGGDPFVKDRSEFLSGALGEGDAPFAMLTHYGESPAECELLDHAMIAVKRQTLLVNNLKFDGQFSSHFHEMDFCRFARQAGMKLGTWPIAATRKVKEIGSPDWHAARKVYHNKWVD